MSEKWKKRIYLYAVAYSGGAKGVEAFMGVILPPEPKPKRKKRVQLKIMRRISKKY